jgi:hypothetical protein
MKAVWYSHQHPAKELQGSFQGSFQAIAEQIAYAVENVMLLLG